jgi:hypothetical protein
LIGSAKENGGQLTDDDFEVWEWGKSVELIKKQIG